MSTPVLIVAYSRHDNVVQLINNLHSQGVEVVYLAIDGSKNDNTDLQSKIERTAQTLAVELGMIIKIWKRDLNLGPAVSVITAIDWFFENVDAGIILEDDLFLSTDAVQYFQNSLMSFQKDEAIFMVAGSNYFENSNSEQEQLVTHYPVIWGWATWTDRWRDYRAALNHIYKVRVPGSISERWFWEIGTRRCLEGMKDAWDIPLAAYQLSVGKLTILPPMNLVSNRGADDFAGNTYIDEWPLNIPVNYLNSSSLKLNSFNYMELSDEVIYATDELFRKRIYKIKMGRTLPAIVSKFLDLVRYPVDSRDKPLLQRLRQVNIPT